MKLLTQYILKKLMLLYVQDDKGEKAIVFIKFVMLGSGLPCLVTEGSPVMDANGIDVNFYFFGPVNEFVKQLWYASAYLNLSIRYLLWLLIKRDVYWVCFVLVQSIIVLT